VRGKEVNKKIVILSIMIAVIFIAVPVVEAYSPSIHDDNWDVYTSGDDVVKPDTTVRYRIWGTLHAGLLGARAKLVAQISVYTTGGWTTIYSDYILPEGDYRGDVSFDKTFSVNVPKNTVLNTPVYLRLETLTREWTHLVLSIVQDPAYDQLKREYDSLQKEYNDYKATHSHSNSEYDSLRNEYDSYKATHSHTDSEYNNAISERDYWKNEYQSLNSTYNEYKATHSHTNNEYEELASKYNSSSSELGTTRTLNYIFIIIAVVFIATTVYSIIRRPKVKPA
jgi:hypothetical protein